MYLFLHEREREKKKTTLKKAIYTHKKTQRGTEYKLEKNKNDKKGE